ADNGGLAGRCTAAQPEPTAVNFYSPGGRSLATDPRHFAGGRRYGRDLGTHDARSCRRKRVSGGLAASCTGDAEHPSPCGVCIVHRVFGGQTASRPPAEEDSVAPASQRGETILAGERMAVDLFGAHIVRPAGIYGPGREMLIRKVFGQKPVQYERQTNRIHQTDLVRALYAMITLDEPPKVVHASDQAPGALLGDVV